MSSFERRRFDGGAGVSRSRFLQLTAGGLAWLATGIRQPFAAPYRVGMGKQGEPYASTVRAVEASSGWPPTEILGKTVIIKPNLVAPVPSDTGVTTDSEVVRAVIDLALGAGAAQVVIVEGGYGGANFSACGYDFFSSYNPRVSLVDLNDESLELVNVPVGLAYRWGYTCPT